MVRLILASKIGLLGFVGAEGGHHEQQVGAAWIIFGEQL
jgi:nicotinamide mononucleotide (NMN) deamidase PncC